MQVYCLFKNLGTADISWLTTATQCVLRYEESTIKKGSPSKIEVLQFLHQQGASGPSPCGTSRQATSQADRQAASQPASKPACLRVTILQAEQPGSPAARQPSSQAADQQFPEQFLEQFSAAVFGPGSSFGTSFETRFGRLVCLAKCRT